MSTAALADWKSLPEGKEKYAAYLCSREWSVLKEAVHARAGEVCERCRFIPIAAVHHLTYERKYCEELTDLAGWCEHCHAYTHGKVQFDPAGVPWILRHYLAVCRRAGRAPMPFQVQDRLVTIKPSIQGILTAIEVLCAMMRSHGYPADLAFEDAAIHLDNQLPFAYYIGYRDGVTYLAVQEYDFAARLAGLQQANIEEIESKEEEDEEEFGDA